jgi:hypothetical protein
MSFQTRRDYGKESAITIPIALYSDMTTHILVRAKIDTGSDLCVFQKSYSFLLGLNLEDGKPQRIRTAVGSFVAYGHELTVRVEDLEWQATVYFAEPDDFSVNVVGRTGFLDRLRLGLVDYERLLYLSSYNE